jgi:cell division septation protein DedD
MKTPPKEQEGPKPVPKEQEPVKFAPKVVEKTTPLPQETAKLEKTFIQGNYYAIQVGAFQNFEYARDLVESLKKDGLDAYWLKKGTLYKVFVGQFANKNEAVQYLKGQKTLNNYPGSYPQKVSSPMASSTEIDPQ